MQLSAEQASELLEKLKELWVAGKACSVCHGDRWEVSDRIYEMREFQGGGLVLGKGEVYPVIIATCAKCGNTKLFNAVVLGLLAAEAEKASAGG